MVDLLQEFQTAGTWQHYLKEDESQLPFIHSLHLLQISSRNFSRLVPLIAAPEDSPVALQKGGMIMPQTLTKYSYSQVLLNEKLGLLFIEALSTEIASLVCQKQPRPTLSHDWGLHLSKSISLAPRVGWPQEPQLLGTEKIKYQGSYSGSKGSPSLTSALSPPAAASATPLVVASLSGITTPAVLTSPKPSSSSPSAMIHRTRNIVSKKKEKKSRRILAATTRSKEKLWVFLSLVRNQQRKKEKLNLPLNHGRSSLSLSLWVEDKKKGKEKALFLFVLPKISVTHSLPWWCYSLTLGRK